MGLAVACISAPVVAKNETGLRKQATWNWPDREQLQSRLPGAGGEASIPQDITRDWADAADTLRGPQLLDAWLRIVAKVDAGLQPLADSLREGNDAAAARKSLTLFEQVAATVPADVKANLQLALGRQLTQHELYDEAIDQLSALTTEQVVDPSSLLFYQAAAYHHVLRRDDCLAAIDRLLQREEELASRFAVLSKLMKADIEPMKADSLDEIARLMNDVQRRLDLQRSGKIVRGQEDQIVEKLDKKIDEMEQQLQQMQQMQQQAQSQQDKQQKQGNAQPMEDSRIAGAHGPGDVDQKNLGNSGGWGNLPAAQRQEALQNITQDLPSHYRDVIEAYFKKLATESP